MVGMMNNEMAAMARQAICTRFAVYFLASPTKAKADKKGKKDKTSSKDKTDQ